MILKYDKNTNTWVLKRTYEVINITSIKMRGDK